MRKKLLHIAVVGSVFLFTLITAEARDFRDGVVFTMDNATSSNHILAFVRDNDGTLTPAGSFATDGKGTGAGLGNQGGLIISRRNHWLLAINAGSNEISVFRVWDDQLELTDKVESGGKHPISIALHGRLVYVLNAGGGAGSADNITGFSLDYDGKLQPLKDSTRSLSAANTGPAEIAFNNDGSVLMVTEKNTNSIDTFTVGDDGLVKSRKTIPSAGKTPFGFAVGDNASVLVSEANGGAANGSSVSSYDLNKNGMIKVVSASVPTNQTAACWVVVTENGRYAYTSNTGSGSISAYRVNGGNGTISLLDSRAGTTGDDKSAPIDMALSKHSRFLYSLNSGNNSISAFKIRSDGSLQDLSGVTDLPPGANGLAAW
jgi:6-phosphogluconolactonase